MSVTIFVQFFGYIHEINIVCCCLKGTKQILNKRAQRALGRSPERSKVTVEPIIENPRGII